MVYSRPSGERLAEHLIKAVQLAGCDCTDYGETFCAIALYVLNDELVLKGILTTPQLHYIVRCINTNGAYGEPSEEGYYQKLVNAFNQLLPKVRNCRQMLAQA